MLCLKLLFLKPEIWSLQSIFLQDANFKLQGDKYMIFGFILVAIGAIFLLQNLNIIQGAAWKIIWPVTVILIGIGFIVSRIKKGRTRGERLIDRKKAFREKFGENPGIPPKDLEKWHRENE